MSWRLPIVFIALTHVALPLLLRWTAPSALDTVGGWAGAALFVGELLALAFTSIAVAQRWSLEQGLETGLIALTIFLFLPSVIVTYLGLAERLSLVSVLIATGAAEIALLSLSRRGDAIPLKVSPKLASNMSFAERFLVALSVFAFAIMAFKAIRSTPNDSDTMWYHLPMLAEWIKTKSIAPVASISLMARGYPGAREAILVWLSLPMTSENLAFLSLLEVSAAFFVIHAICREFEIPRALSLAAAALFVTTPEISMWSGSQKNDLFLTVVFLLVFFFMMRWLRTGCRRHALLAGLSAGLLCATKMSGPAYASALLAMLAGALALRRQSERPASVFRGIVLMASASLAVAAPWYIRNLAYFHNPFFPKHVAVFGRTLFEGPLGASFFAPVTLGFDFPRLFANWRQFSDELGLALGLLVVSPLLLLVIFLWRNRGRIKAETLLWLAVLPALLLAVYMVQPFSLLSRGLNSWQVQPRFLLPFAACLHVTAAFLLSRLPGSTRFALPAVAVIALANIASWTHFWYLLGMLALLSALFFSWAENAERAAVAWALQNPRYLPAAVAVAFLILTATSHWLDGFREQRKDNPEYGYAGGISPGWGSVSLYVRHHIFEQRILCLGRPECFPLYGRGYTNDLFAAADADAADAVQRNHIDYVVGFRPFVRRGSTGENWEYLPPVTNDLRQRYPGKFKVVYSSDGAEILKVLE